MQDGMVCRFARNHKRAKVGSWWLLCLRTRSIRLLDGDDCVLEKSPLERLSQDRQLMAYCHDGFWQPMDTLREKQLLEELWVSNKAPGRERMMTTFSEAYRGKKVLITGLTGFKGQWLGRWLNRLGAHVCGFGLAPTAAPTDQYPTSKMNLMSNCSTFVNVQR